MLQMLNKYFIWISLHTIVINQRSNKNLCKQNFAVKKYFDYIFSFVWKYHSRTLVKNNRINVVKIFKLTFFRLTRQVHHFIDSFVSRVYSVLNLSMNFIKGKIKKKKIVNSGFAYIRLNWKTHKTLIIFFESYLHKSTGICTKCHVSEWNKIA